MNIYDYSETDEIALSADDEKFLEYMKGKEYTYDNVLKFVKEVLFSPGFGGYTIHANTAETLYERFK